MHESVENINSTLYNVQRPGSKFYGGIVGASSSTKRKCVENGGKYVMRDGSCLSLHEVLDTVERVRAAVPLGPSLARMLGELFREDCLVSFLDCVEGRMRKDGGLAFYYDVRLVSVRSELTGGHFCRSSNVCNEL